MVLLRTEPRHRSSRSSSLARTQVSQSDRTGHREHPVTKAGGGFSVVEHDAAANRLPVASFSFRKPRKSAGTTLAEAFTSRPTTLRAPRSMTRSTSTPSLSRKWKNGSESGTKTPADAAPETRTSRGADQRAPDPHKGPRRRRRGANRPDPSVAHVELRRLDQTAEPIAVPGRQLFQQRRHVAAT